MILKTIKLSLIFSLFFTILSACSLNYADENSPEERIPEFTFSNVKFLRYERSKITMEMNTDILEQYKNSGASFAKNTGFQTYNKEGKEETQGKCDFLSADTEKENYILLGDIYLKIFSQDMEIFAESLNYDKHSEQLTAGKDDEVTIARNDTEITGKGFSASSLSKTYSFDQAISGTIETDSQENGDQSENPQGKDS